MFGKTIGILTAGGDSPGLNAAIRGVGKVALNKYGLRLIGFRDGFRGLMQNRIEWLGPEELSGILTLGGTILGTSRDKPHKMPIGGKTRNMMDVMVENYRRHDLEALICVGGGGTAKNAWRLAQQGINVVCLPKTIDNDVSGTDVTFASIPPSISPPKPSTACTQRRTAIIASLSSRSWGTIPAGWLWALDWRAGRMSSSSLRFPSISSMWLSRYGRAVAGAHASALWRYRKAL